MHYIALVATLAVLVLCFVGFRTDRRMDRMENMVLDRVGVFDSMLEPLQLEVQFWMKTSQESRTGLTPAQAANQTTHVMAEMRDVVNRAHAMTQNWAK